MARAIDEIIRELDASYNPQRQSIQERLDALPGQADAEIKGLEGQQTQAFNSILAGARDRGLGFSGIPLAEQAQYTSGQFLPAVARVRQSQNETKRSLSDALNNIGLEQNKFAQSLRQQELDRDWAREQFDRQMAAEERARAAANSFSPTYGGASGGGGSSPSASMQQRADKGFSFSINGQPVSAALYAQATGQNFRAVLEKMAKAGDQGAKAALGFVGDDYGYDPRKIASKQQADLYNALVWGTNRSAQYNAPANSGRGTFVRPAPQQPSQTNRLLSGIPGVR